MSSASSHFFAYISRLRLIQRWGLMYNVHPENVQEHTMQVCFIAHILAVIKNRVYQGEVDPARTALLAMYHDTSEVITGDLPTPIKYFSPQIKKAYKEIEQIANVRLFQFLPKELQGAFTSVFFPEEDDQQHWELVKAADKISAYLKCVEEMKAGNQEFARASAVLLKTIEKLEQPEVKYFMEVFLPSMELTLDELE